MQMNPYSPPKAPLSEPRRLLQTSRTAFAPAIFSFLAFPAIVFLLGLAKGAGFPTFILDDRFITTLAGCSIAGGIVVALTSMRGWVRYLVATLVAWGLLIAIILWLG